MSASTRSGGALLPQAAAALEEGIGLVFARWTALQMAVENQWGARDSRAKADQLTASILSWFSNSKGPYYFDDLEDMMYESISESFNADIEDGSVGEVAEQLLIMHEECVESNYSSIEKLRNTRVQGNAVSQSRQFAARVAHVVWQLPRHFAVLAMVLASSYASATQEDTRGDVLEET